jgi:hypothetical protein
MAIVLVSLGWLLEAKIPTFGILGKSSLRGFTKPGEIMMSLSVGPILSYSRTGILPSPIFEPILADPGETIMT